jgi:hypothetical protein
MDVEGLQLVLNLGFGHELAYVLQQQAQASILLKRKSVKTHTLSLSLSLSRDRREPIVARKPSVVSGTSIMFSPFVSATRLLADFVRIQSRNLRDFFTRHAHRSFLVLLLGGTTLSTWALSVMPIDATLSGPDTSTGAPERCACELLSSKQLVPMQCQSLGCGLDHPSWLVWRGEVSPPAVVPTVTSFPLWETWTQVEFRGTPSFPSLLAPPEKLIFSGERCRVIHPSINSFYRSSGHFPCGRRTNLRAAELSAA